MHGTCRNSRNSNRGHSKNAAFSRSTTECGRHGNQMSARNGKRPISLQFYPYPTRVSKCPHLGAQQADIHRQLHMVILTEIVGSIAKFFQT